MAELETQVIGDISKGIDGCDRYLLVIRKDDDITEQDITDQVFPVYYRRCRGAGTSFCHSFRYIPDPVHSDRAIVIIQQRYDN